VLQEIANNFVFESQNALVELPCSHTTNHCKNPVDFHPFINVLTDICYFVVAQLCIEPVYDTKSVKYSVFLDLWRRGKFVTSGEAFGADFLVYPGDPLLYHASHIVIILESPVIRPLELICKVRLSVTVKKDCVFAYKQTDESNIFYQTVKWCK